MGAFSSSMTVSYSSTSDKYIWVLVNPTYSNSNATFSVYTNPKSTSDSSSSSSSSDSNDTVIIVAVICGTVGIVIIIGAIGICVICKMKANKNRMEQYAQIFNPNFQGRTFRTTEYNNVSHLSIVVDDQFRHQGNISLPNAFHTRLSDPNKNIRPSSTHRSNNNPFNHNALELGFPTGHSIELNNGSRVLEGRRVNYNLNRSLENGGEMPVYQAK